MFYNWIITHIVNCNEIIMSFLKLTFFYFFFWVVLRKSMCRYRYFLKLYSFPLVTFSLYTPLLLSISSLHHFEDFFFFFLPLCLRPIHFFSFLPLSLLFLFLSFLPHWKSKVRLPIRARLWYFDSRKISWRRWKVTFWNLRRSPYNQKCIQKN